VGAALGASGNGLGKARTLAFVFVTLKQIDQVGNQKHNKRKEYRESDLNVEVVGWLKLTGLEYAGR